MSETAIHIEHVSKLYKLYDKPTDRMKEAFSITKKKYGKEFYALDDINFDIKKGENVGIIGRNGSGKSTLLKILTGVLNPTSGEIGINGNISALLELGAGFNMEYTGMENIYLNGTILNIPREEMEKKVPEILEFADIGDYIHQPAKTYSSGMFVRLAFAVAINVNPEILIVDEALAVGDTRFQLKCMDKFMEFQEAGKTILFVSHDINQIKRFCTRAIWINNGKMIMDGDTDEVTDKYMDFLKSELPIEEYLSSIEQCEPVECEQEVIDEASINAVDIAEITDFKMFNKNGKEIQDIQHNQDVDVRIRYIVNDETVENPVLGVAIRSIDNEYICGINTLLDKKKIPWKRGMNECILHYERFNLTGGSYYFDAALMDATATVNIDYKTKIKTFFVKMEYVAEGKVVLYHQWN